MLFKKKEIETVEPVQPQLSKEELKLIKLASTEQAIKDAATKYVYERIDDEDWSDTYRQIVIDLEPIGFKGDFSEMYVLQKVIIHNIEFKIIEEEQCKRKI